MLAVLRFSGESASLYIHEETQERRRELQSSPSMNTSCCARPASLMEIISTAAVVCSSAIDDAVAFVAPDTASQSVLCKYSIRELARGEDIGDRLGLVSKKDGPFLMCQDMI